MNDGDCVTIVDNGCKDKFEFVSICAVSLSL
jgi:hypothetical protein